MKIERIETIRLEEHPNLTFVEIMSDDGLVGLGETFYSSAAVSAHIHGVLADLLLGEDPTRLEWLGLRMHGYAGYAGSGVETRSRSALDIALHDLIAQQLGVPLHDLLGGRTRESIRIYNTCAGTRYVRRPGQTVANWGIGVEGRYEDLTRFLVDPVALAQDLLDQGITGMKVWPFDPCAEATLGNDIRASDLRTAMRPLEQIRDAVGDAMDIMVELHGLWGVPAATKIVQALASIEPYWIEDPVRGDIVGGLAAVSAASSSWIAAGETISGPRAFLPLLAARAIDVVTLDVGWTGGLGEARKVAALAESHGVAIAPHDCTGPIALVVATHLSMAAPNALIQETVRAQLHGWYRDLVTELPPVADGLIRPPVGAGLGTRLLPDLKQRPGTIVEVSETRRTPVWTGRR